jgi:hypothetical protein
MSEQKKLITKTIEEWVNVAPEGKKQFLNDDTVVALKNVLRKIGMFGGVKSKTMVVKMHGKKAGKKAMNKANFDKPFAKKYRFMGVYQKTYTSSSGTAQAPVEDVSPFNCTEWSSIASLFDMARVHNVVMQVSIQLPSTNVLPVEVGFAYDPFNAAAYSSALNVQQSPNSVYFIVPGTADSVQTFNKSGFRTLHAKMTKQPVIFGAGSVTGYVGSNWFNTNTASANTSIVGFFKGYIDPATAGASIVTVNYLVNMEFMSRS